MSNRLEQLLVAVGNRRPIVSTWKHFVEVENDYRALADTIIAFQEKYEWDFIKVNPRATYYAEAFGNIYNKQNYTDVLPELVNYPIKRAEDLDFFLQEKAAEYKPFYEQVLLAKRVRKGVGDNIPILQTLFSPLCILTFLAGHNPYPGVNKPKSKRESELNVLIEKNPAGVKSALEKITEVLKRYVRDTLENEIDGFFYSIFGHGDEGELAADVYAEFSAPYDNQIFETIKEKGGTVMFHTCGPASHPEKFSQNKYIDIIHWADQEEHTPSLEKDMPWLNEKIAAGGVDQNLFKDNNRDKILNQAQKAADARKGLPFILTAGCGLPVVTNDESIWALKQAVVNGKK